MFNDEAKSCSKKNPENISVRLDTLLKDEENVVLIKFDIEFVEQLKTKVMENSYLKE